VDFRLVAHGSSEYDRTLDLRMRVLRAPLGLVFDAKDLAREAGDLHLAAFDSGRLIACLVLTPQTGSAIKMRQVAVEPDRQGSGIGRRLVEGSEEVAREHGYREMVLNARDSAVPFYLHLGYQLVGEPFIEVTIPHRRMRKLL
jgi:predicted GNAT family N-acyltransferase